VRWGRSSSLLGCLLSATAFALATAPAASAGPHPALVVWAGPLVPGTALHGVELKANGTGRRLLVKRNNRASGDVTTAGSLLGIFVGGRRTPST
jgi:hypothetical protein